MATRREPVSIVTVFNDPEMRRECLDRSIDSHLGTAPEIEFLPIDNTQHAFTSAGAALNHGASRARHDYVAFVHQDVYLHSLTALEEAAGRLADDASIGLLGCVGIASDGSFHGRVRDRIFLLGEPAPAPVAVDSVDELLFVIPRRELEHEPLTEDPDFQWHAYAVEYGLRVRARGKRVCATDIPVTHNSLTVNLDRLEEAYATLASRYAAQMPVQTPQGIVGAGTREHTGILAGQRWRYRWLLESVAAEKGRRAGGGVPCILDDIRLDVDELLATSGEPLLIVNADRSGTFMEEEPAPLRLTRQGHPVLLTSRPTDAVPDAVQAGRPTLITNLDLDAVRRLSPRLPAGERLLGYWSSLGYWILLGMPPSRLPVSWRERRATPLGREPLA